MKEKRKRAPRASGQGCMRLLRITCVALLVAYLTVFFLYNLFYLSSVQRSTYQLLRHVNFAVPVAKSSELIAFTCDNGVYTIQPDGTNLRRIQAGLLLVRGARIAWSPDGEWLAMPLHDQLAKWRGPEVFTVHFDGSITNRLTFNIEEESFIQWSLDGTAVLYVREHKWIHRVSPDGNEEYSQLDTRTELDSSFYPTSSQRISPDGKWLVTVRLRRLSVRVSTLIFYALDGSGQKWERVVPGVVHNIQWAADSERITFEASDEQHIFNIKTRTNEHVLDLKAYFAAWSPSGRWIALSVRDAEWQWNVESLSVLDTETGEVQRLTGDIGKSRFSWSPDGEWIAFTEVRRNGPNQLVIISRDGNRKRQVTNLGCDVGHISWSPR